MEKETKILGTLKFDHENQTETFTPSPPPLSIDEAARAYCQNKAFNPDFIEQSIKLAFKAGAEHQARQQPVTNNSKINNMKTETRLLLEDFRKEQSELFDATGSAHKTLSHVEPMNRMLKLINGLELEFLHQSDCARHNEPAMPNGLCDCHLSDKIKSPELRKEIQELFNSSGVRYPEDMHLQKDVEDILLKHLL